MSFSEATEKDGKNNNEGEFDDFVVADSVPELHSVDPRKGRSFRGVHKVLVDIGSF